jgi:hypothetical protein
MSSTYYDKSDTVPVLSSIYLAFGAFVLWQKIVFLSKMLFYFSFMAGMTGYCRYREEVNT